MNNQKEKPTMPTTPTTPTMSIILPDNCFGIGPYWSPQVWAAFFVDHRTAAFLEYQEHGPRIFVEWTKKSGASILTLGWCPPGSWVPAKTMMPLFCSDVRATLHAGGVGVPEPEWGYELRALLTAHSFAADPLDSLFAWTSYMIKKAQAAGVEVRWAQPKTKVVEPEPETEPAEPAESEPPLAPLPRGYEWELNLSSKGTGRLDGCVTIFRQNKVCEESPRSAQEKLCLTFKLDNEDLRAHARLLRSLVKSGTFEQALGQLLNLARNE